MGWIKKNLRQLRWQLTLSYTAVTVVSLLVLVMIAAGILFSQILLPMNALSPQDWVNIVRDQSQFPLNELLSNDPINFEVVSKVFEDLDPVIVSRKIALFSDLEIYARSTGVVDIIVTDHEGRLVAVTNRYKYLLLPNATPGETFDPGLVPGLEKPLKAALEGKTYPDAVFHAFEDGDGFLMAIPIFHSEITGKVVGAIVYYMYDLSTENDRSTYFVTVLLRSLFVILVAAGIVGATFGALTAEGLAGRFRRLVSASEAWSSGNFSARIREESSDEIGQLANRLDGMAEELRELVHKRQELAVSQERSRLARDLHDSAKQLALAASFKIATAKELFDRDIRSARENLDDAEKLVDKVRTELTDLIHELRSTHMDGRDFNEIVRTYAAQWTHSSGIGVQIEMPVVENLTLDAEEGLYRILQEALANIARHSGANHVFIQMEQHNGEIQLNVRDDGKGFGVEPYTRGMGLSSMEERAEALGGFTRINSQPGSGTEVRVVLPLVKKEGKND